MVGSVVLVEVAVGVAERQIFLASLVYSICLLAMLGCSAAYNLAASASRRGFLRQLDHAAIFLMIAGTYTPFTTCRLHGVWAIGMTAAVWTGAITGAATKLICPRGIKPGSIVAYLALGWMIMLGMRPMLASVDALTAILIGVGGRALFHRRRFSPLADAAILQRNMAQLRAGRSQLSLRSYSARRSLGTNLSAGWQKLNLSPVRGGDAAVRARLCRSVPIMPAFP